jgi:hypothetical protein
MRGVLLMKRDMELMRKILFKIEEDYVAGSKKLKNLKIGGYDTNCIAEHCELLYQAGLIKLYEPSYAGDSIYFFDVGNLSNRGYDYLELIRNDDIWDKTKKEIEEKKLPKTVEFIAKVAGVFSGNFVKEFNS